MIGLGVLQDPVVTVQRLAEQALVRAGASSFS